MTQLDLYATPDPLTQPGAMAPLLDGLPADVAELVRVVQGLLLRERPHVKRIDPQIGQT
jgi:hypothetical protein